MRLHTIFVLTAIAAVAAAFAPAPASAYIVNVQIQGAGIVTGPGINCSSSLATPDTALGQGGDCSADYGVFAGPTTLVAAPHVGSASYGWIFQNWSGCLSAVGTGCSFGGVFDGATYLVRAVFNDIAGPSIAITAGPAEGQSLSSTSATFGQSTTDSVATFRCSLDGANPPVSFCGSASSYASLAQGAHTYRVRAVDPSGNTSPTSTRTWTVDTVAPPAPTVSAGPSGSVGSAAASFVFASESGAAFDCRLDGAAFAACTSPKAYSALAEGAHAFEVRAKDAAGNLSPVTRRDWTVDTIAPSVPAPFQNGLTPTSLAIGWSPSADAGGVMGYDVFLNGAHVAALGAGTTSHTLSGLSCATLYAIGVEAFDAAGNRSSRGAASISTADCPRDTAAPDTRLLRAPGRTTRARTASFRFASTEPGSTFQCKLDRGRWAACRSPKTYRGLKKGTHTFQVRAIDAAGNVDRTPVKKTWRVR